MRAMIIPGNHNASLSQEWYPYVKREMERLGIKTVAKDMPDPEIARRKIWIPFIEKQLENSKDSILIGHSSGAVAAMRYAEEHEVEGIILVGACHTDTGDEVEKASGYFDGEWQWDKIKKNSKWIVQFASQDDTYVPITEARHVHEMLGSEYYEYPNRGHFWGNMKEFPEIIKVVKRKIA